MKGKKKNVFILYREIRIIRFLIQKIPNGGYNFEYKVQDPNTRKSFNKDEECFRGQKNWEDFIPQAKVMEFSNEPLGPSPLVSVLQLQRVDHVVSSVRLGVTVSPFQLQALRPRSSTFEPRRQGW